MELDGSVHYQPKNILHDRYRSEFLADFGIQIIRFRNIVSPSPAKERGRGEVDDKREIIYENNDRLGWGGEVAREEHHF